MREQRPPELADGGYWYVVPAVPHASDGGHTPGEIPVSWCAWYGAVASVDYAVIRTVRPAGGIETADVSVVGVLAAVGAAKRPRARIAGA